MYFVNAVDFNSRIFPKILFFLGITGIPLQIRSRVRPRKRWLDSVKEDWGRAGLTLTQAVREAHNRVKWRSIWKLSLDASASPGH